MVDSASERCIQSLQRANEELLEISKTTIFSSPWLQYVSGSTKAQWLDDEDILNAYQNSFKIYQMDDKFNAVRKLNSSSRTDENQSSELTVKEKLIESRTFMEKELTKIKEEQALLESAISVSLKRLENAQIPVIKQSVV